jgi:hypothetical protein
MQWLNITKQNEKSVYFRREYATFIHSLSFLGFLHFGLCGISFIEKQDCMAQCIYMFRKFIFLFQDERTFCTDIVFHDVFQLLSGEVHSPRHRRPIAKDTFMYGFGGKSVFPLLLQVRLFCD